MSASDEMEAKRTRQTLEAPAMQLPRVRFTVRRMMIVVAVVAIMTTIGMSFSPELSRRWRACQAAANRHAQLAQMYSANANLFASKAPWSRAMAESAATSRQKAAVHREISRRNRWAFVDPFHQCVLDEDIY
jgi:Tfp pilus assembly protein PilE